MIEMLVLKMAAFESHRTCRWVQVLRGGPQLDEAMTVNAGMHSAAAAWVTRNDIFMGRGADHGM